MLMTNTIVAADVEFRHVQQIDRSISRRKAPRVNKLC